MKVFVTGSEGFIGSHLAEALCKAGHEVRCLVQYNSFGNIGWLGSLSDGVAENLEIIPGDIRDSAMMDKIVEDVEVVFHTAALIAIPYSYSAPESYIDTNIKGTLNILNACRKHETNRILITSTSEVYGTAMYVPIDEKHPKQGQSPYSASKIGADALAESYYRSFGMPITIVRPFNTYGPRQSARAVIPTIITQILSGAKKIKLGSLHPTRDLVYVKDTAEGFLRISQCSSLIGEEVNIATQNEISIGELAGKIIEMTGGVCEIVTDDVRLRPDKSEVERLLGSADKLEKFTKWKPATSLDEGLKETLNWFRDPDNLKHYRSEIYNV